MKKIILLLVGLLICGSVFSQEDKAKNYPRIPSVDLKTLDGETFPPNNFTTATNRLSSAFGLPGVSRAKRSWMPSPWCMRIG